MSRMALEKSDSFDEETEEVMTENVDEDAVTETKMCQNKYYVLDKGTAAVEATM